MEIALELMMNLLYWEAQQKGDQLLYAAHLKAEELVASRISSGFSCQFLSVPLTRPDTTMNSSTKTLMQVKTLVTMADSFTPKASKPV